MYKINIINAFVYIDRYVCLSVCMYFSFLDSQTHTLARMKLMHISNCTSGWEMSSSLCPGRRNRFG